MDEATLVRELLERATVPEPPIGPIAQNAVRAGLRLRRRRRVVLGATTGAAAAAVICVAAFAGTGVIGNRTAAPGDGPGTVYVYGGVDPLTVTPISITTNRRGRPIVVNAESMSFGMSSQLAATPDGKTLWITDTNQDVTPISTATGRAGHPVQIVPQPDAGTSQILVTPDGKTVYVLDSSGTVTPVSTATHLPGHPIEVGHLDADEQMAMTPDSKTLYVGVFSTPSSPPSYVIPIATATNRPGKRITLPTNANAMAISTDGKTLYVSGQPVTGPVRRIEVTPIATASNRPGPAINAGNGTLAWNSPVAMSPDGQTMFIGTRNGVIPLSTATNTPGKLISFGAAVVTGIAIAPDGGTAYVLSQPPGNLQRTGIPADGGYSVCIGPPGAVTPISTATDAVGKPIPVGCRPSAAAFAPDGRTLYVGGESSAVTPITTATGRAGKPIDVEAPQVAMLTVPVPR